MTVKEIVLAKILEEIEKGVIPWETQWYGKPKINFVTRKPYRGINQMLLQQEGEYLSFAQIKQLKGTLKKGSKSNLCVFWKHEDGIKVNEDGEISIQDDYWIMRYYYIFHLSCVDGIESKIETHRKENNQIEECDKIVAGYKNKPSINEGSPSYSPTMDIVFVPNKRNFTSDIEYYSSLFHELAHSTGHKDRLNRKTIYEAMNKEIESYSKEELVAAMAQAMLSNMSGIGNETIKRYASYIDNWLNVLKRDKNMLFVCSGQAQKAVDYIIKGEKNV